MKKIVFIFLGLLCYSFSHAQETKVEKGLVIGGSLSGTYQQDIRQTTTIPAIGGFVLDPEVNRNTTIRLFIRPYLGKKLNSKSILGFTPILGYSRNANSMNEVTNFVSSVFDLGGGFFYRYYLNPKNKLKGFVQPFTNFTASFGNIEQFAPVLIETRAYTFNLGVGFGATYDLNDKWRLLVNVWSTSFQNSSFNSGNQESSTRSNSIDLNFSISNIRFGLERFF